jgi:hypothetical protein
MFTKPYELFIIHLLLLTVGLTHGHKRSAYSTPAGGEHTGCSPEQLSSVNAALDYVSKACTTAANNALDGSRFRYIPGSTTPPALNAALLS